MCVDGAFLCLICAQSERAKTAQSLEKAPIFEKLAHQRVDLPIFQRSMLFRGFVPFSACFRECGLPPFSSDPTSLAQKQKKKGVPGPESLELWVAASEPFRRRASVSAFLCDEG